MNRCAFFGCGASAGMAMTSKNSVAPVFGISASMTGPLPAWIARARAMLMSPE